MATKTELNQAWNILALLGADDNPVNLLSAMEQYRGAFTSFRMIRLECARIVQVCETCGKKEKGSISQDYYVHCEGLHPETKQHTITRAKLDDVIAAYNTIFPKIEVAVPNLPKVIVDVERPVEMCESCFLSWTHIPDVLIPELLPKLGYQPPEIKSAPIESPNADIQIRINELDRKRRNPSKRAKPRQERGKQKAEPKPLTNLSDLFK